MKKVLVLYYSFEGNTKKVAEVLASTLGAQIEEIKPVEELKSKGFSKFIWGGSQVVMGKKPEIVEIKSDLSEYDLIFVGSPIWAGTYAPPIKTLLEDKLENKKIAYFYTHDGGYKKATEKGKEVIETKNIFLGAIDLQTISKNWDSSKEKITLWGKNIVETN